MHIEKLTRDTLAPYLPVKDGIFNLAFLPAAVLASAASWTFILRVLLDGSRDTVDGLLAGPAVGMALVCPLFAAVLIMRIWLQAKDDFNGGIRDWFKAVHARNWVGYELWCCRELYGEDESVRYQFCRRGTGPHAAGQSVIISIPLSGGICVVAVPDWRERVHWTIYPNEPSLRTDAVAVTMSDGAGNKFTVGIETALRVLVSERTTAANKKLADNAGSIGELVEGILNRLDAAQEDLVRERSQRDMAVGHVDEAVTMIKDTTRFGRSKQGGEIRAWLEAKLADHLAFRDVPRRKRDAA